MFVARPVDVHELLQCQAGCFRVLTLDYVDFITGYKDNLKIIAHCKIRLTGRSYRPKKWSAITGTLEFGIFTNILASHHTLLKYLPKYWPRIISVWKY